MIRFPKPLLALAKQNFVLGQTIKALHIPPEFAAQYERATKQMTPELFVKISRDAHDFRPPDALKAVTIPTLAVAGSKEPGVNRRATQMIAALMPNAKGYVAPDLGHMWNVENPQLFNRMVRSWLTDTALPAELRPLAA
jgi:pimeloyl-ACP methyl ester carboxylesterase